MPHFKKKKNIKKERFPLTRFLNNRSEETTTNDSSHLLCAVVLQFFSDRCMVLIKCFISLCPTVPHMRISRVCQKHTPSVTKITIYLVSISCLEELVLNQSCKRLAFIRWSYQNQGNERIG